MSLYCETPFARVFDMARAERALENYKLNAPPDYRLEASKFGCDREGFKLLQKYTTTSFFSHLAGQDIIRYLEGAIVIGPAPQPYPAISNGMYQEDLPVPPPIPTLGVLAKTSNGKYTTDAQNNRLQMHMCMRWVNA